MNRRYHETVCCPVPARPAGRIAHARLQRWNQPQPPPMPCSRPSRPAGGAASASTEASRDFPPARSGSRAADRSTRPPRRTPCRPPRRPSPRGVASIAPMRSPRVRSGLRDRTRACGGTRPSCWRPLPSSARRARWRSPAHDGRPHGGAARRLLSGGGRGRESFKAQMIVADTGSR